jgi:hypothetical protein
MSSRLIVNSIRHTGASGDAVTLANDGTCTANITNNLSNKNVLINGAININQRGAYTGQGTSGKYGPDRWQLAGNSSGMQHAFVHQDTGMPEFPKCLRMDCTTAATGTVTEVKITQKLESQDLGRFLFGNSSAKSLTVSFWCRSNQASTFVVWMHRDDGSRHTSKTFTINSADTWEKKTLTFSPDQTGTPANDNTRGLQIAWVLASGSGYTSGTSPNGTWENITDVNRYVGITATIGGNTNDYFDLTGVQLEVSDHATDFEHRSYGDELAKCQRYYFQNFTSGQAGYYFMQYHPTHRMMVFDFPVPMRSTPTATYSISSGSATPSGHQTNQTYKAYIAINYDTAGSRYTDGVVKMSAEL